MSALLSLRGVGKRFWRGEVAHWPLRRVDLNVAAGEVVAVVGMRSQGKTTLLRIAAGMLAPDEGAVLLDGQRLEQLSDRAHARVLRQRIGLAGRRGPRIDLRMLDYVAMRLTIGRRRQRRDAQAGALAALERVGVEHGAARHWEELSDWERALVELAQAIAPAPRLLLIDDLIDGLGMRETEQLARLVRTLAEQERIGVLMAVSDPEAALCAHRVLSLADGRLRQLSGPPGEGMENVIDFPRVPDTVRQPAAPTVAER
ncbi:MAG TPA: ABC transporter ATP-binding protein [Solirubrobacteraceae bacterium]|jgi:ABC-type cobalamin/Fe3+-siderophores transport system ATPase subunit|nr:ABC transporter ATP-binding protein [Solirubrobacteraceae bacterium]